MNPYDKLNEKKISKGQPEKKPIPKPYVTIPKRTIYIKICTSFAIE